MYNQERKEKYLNQCNYSDETKEMIRKLFVYSERDEIDFGCDLSDFQETIRCHEVRSLFNSLKLKEKEKLETARLMFGDYTSWCISENLSQPYNSYLEGRVKEIIDNTISHTDES